MAESAITAVLSKLGELAVSEAQLLLQVGDDIMLLRDRLEWLQAFVRDTDRKRRAGTDGLTRVWARQTRDVAFQAEDAIDDFFYQEVANLHSKGFRRRMRMARNLFTQIVVRHGLAGRITRIKSRLERISENQKEYNIAYTPSMASASSVTAIAAWQDDMELPLRFGKNLDKIRWRMMVADQMFISIVGESGAGKKTLASSIGYEMDKARFREVVWCKMGSIEDLFRRVYRSATRTTAAFRHDEEVVNNMDYSDKLRNILSGKKYMLILSGITSKSTLNRLRASLPDEDNSSGCRVILLLDAKHEEVAWHANTMNRDGRNGVHMLSRLDQEASGELFFFKVLRKGLGWYFMKDEDPMMEQEVGNNNLKDDERYVQVVHRITGGYPMAIVLLAGLLRFKEKPLQWDAVLQQLISLLPPPLKDVDNKGYNSQTDLPSLCSTKRPIEIIFWASFEDLPNELKPCFLYFAAYPDHNLHFADTLVRMWVAEGFIKPQKDKTMEEVGHDYLKELVSRCLVKLVDTKPGGGISSVVVHNFIVGFLRSEVLESGFMEIHDTHDILVPPSARRVSIQSDNGTTTLANKKFPNLRSYVCDAIQQHHHQDLKFLCRSKFIRIISVWGLCLEELPDKTGDMINLRYVRIDCMSMCHLPSSISRLLNLQTLDIRKTQVKEIHQDFWKIKTLRHVLAESLTLPTAMPIIVTKVQGDGGGGGGGSELQTLHGVKPVASEKWNAGNSPLDKMAFLRSLEMHGFQHEEHGGPAFEAALGKMPLLGHLKLQGDEIPSCVFTDPSLQGLQTMVLDGTINWDNITADVLRKVRPNLARLELKDTSDVPGDIKKQLRTVLFRG